MKITRILPLLLVSLGLSSCVVSKKKYETAEYGRMAALYSRDSLANILGDERTARQKVEDNLASTQKDLASTQSDLANERKNVASLNKALESLKADTARLGNSIRNYQTMLSSSSSKNEKLNALLAEKRSELDEREKTIKDLQAKIKEQNDKVQSLLSSVKKALNGFSSDELTVREEGGKVYVAMSEKLLFKSGKADVNEQGKEALGKLAEVLKKQSDIDINIEGHTDSIPIKNSNFSDNWDLSVIRATSVVRILTQDYGVNPLQIQPCGRGEYKPVDTNTTEEGRARNRRTEIILTPKLDELYKILENN